jgi:hypothetical protein
VRLERDAVQRCEAGDYLPDPARGQQQAQVGARVADDLQVGQAGPQDPELKTVLLPFTDDMM